MVRRYLNDRSQKQRIPNGVLMSSSGGNPTAERIAQRGSRTLMRELNVSLIIELVRSAGSISRAELARPRLARCLDPDRTESRVLRRTRGPP